ncbi:MAG: enoyl-CoA hydratase/isomerase family protein [Chloroflexi bacterium]|nr:enoyl-CoA hydratase/isomerase family protein [Chloroflexota bacterium]
MPPYESVILDKNPDTHIARLTLNRPDRLNAINAQMGLELAEAVEDVAADDDMRVLVLTGAGRGFCSGADTGGMAGGGREQGPHSGERSAEEVRRGFRNAQRLILGLQRMEKPTIAMINGVAVGAGFDLACACDIRIGSPQARFMVAFVRIGLFPGYGGTWLYARALGSVGKAAELLFTGDFMEADEAHRYGLLNHLVEPDRLEPFTMDMAGRIAQGPPIAIRLAKLMLYKGLEFDLETALHMAAAAETITLTSQDHREGVEAFREKRKANYRGR